LTYGSHGGTLAGMRDRLHPGDIGAIVALHVNEYGDGYRLNERFEALVARGLADFALALADDPDAGRAWVEEDRQGLTGCIAITRETESHGRLRWFLVAQRARGQGLGHELLDAALSYARERFTTIELETFSELTAASHLYRAAGFELRDSRPFREWGREIELQHYHLGF
jgi:GNAT superfamily N-acetyltransferase